MTEPVRLEGMTWDHPRGYEPLQACSARWLQERGVAVHWARRSLQDFERFPVEELARQYDLIIIDHPHVGQVTREGCLLPLPADRLAAIEAGDVGHSFDSYRWEGRQWALPVDAATQVQAWRPDRLAAAPTDWSEMITLARAGRVAVPLRAPHALMVLYTLHAHLGGPGRAQGSDLFDVETGSEAFERLRELRSLVDASCLAMDPIAVFDRMAETEATIDCVPLIYGYVSYAHAGFRPVRIAFADMPTIGGRAPAGSALGGTGLAVSARSAHPEEATEFALWVAGAEVQRTLYAAAAGQPGHSAAWQDDAVNRAAGNFYRATRATLDGAWMRPRHDGYMHYQETGSAALLDALEGQRPARATIEALNRLYRQSLPG